MNFPVTMNCGATTSHHGTSLLTQIPSLDYQVEERRVGLSRLAMEEWAGGGGNFKIRWRKWTSRP
jgi:hypothetical protein